MEKVVRWMVTVSVLVLLLSLMLPAEPVHSQAGVVREYNISAIDVDITLNRFGDHDPAGKMFVLDENIQAVRRQETSPLPDRVSIGLRDDPLQALVIRANVGDTVVVNFTNKLPGKRASFAVPQLIKSADDLGSAFGLNNDSTVAPGDTRTYWYVIDPRFEVSRSFVISDYGDPLEGARNGLYGLFIVEPAGSTYHDPATGREVKSGWNVEVRTPDGNKFRDVALIFHDEDPRMGRDIMPYDEDIDGDRAINYRAEPVEKRNNEFPASVLSTLMSPDT